MKVKPGQWNNYLDLEKYVKKFHLAGWSMWHKLTYESDFQYVTADAFAEFGQWKAGLPYQEVFKEVHPDKDMNEIQPRLSESRTQVSSEYWKLVDFVVPPAPAQ